MLPRARDCHGNRMQGGDLQQGFMIDVGGAEDEQRGHRGEEGNEPALRIVVREKL